MGGGGLLVVGSVPNVFSAVRILSSVLRFVGAGTCEPRWSDWSRQPISKVPSYLLVCEAHPTIQRPPIRCGVDGIASDAEGAASSGPSERVDYERGFAETESPLHTRFVPVSSRAELRSLIWRSSPVAIVLDPSCAGLSTEWCTELHEALSDLAQRDLVVLYASVDGASLRGSAALARHVPFRLLIRGEDDGRLREMIVRMLRRDRMSRFGDSVDLSLLQTLPEPLARAWMLALRDPNAYTVKRIALTAGLSRRWIEKPHRRVGLPHPGAVLGAARRRSLQT